MKLSEEQQIALDLALYHDDITTLYITGEGGSGKSEIIKEIVKNLENDDFVLLAPTQSAAENIGGQTIHSFFKVKPTINLKVKKECDVVSFCLNDIDPEVAKGKIIIVDEASMLGETMLKGIFSRILPKKLILFGDPIQCKPVKDFQVNWEDFCQKTVYLTKNFRVKNKTTSNVIKTYRDTGKLLSLDKAIELSDLKYSTSHLYIAHKNDTLSEMQNQLLGYGHAKVGDTMLTFGSCDESIQRLMLNYKKKEVLVPYFNNNDLVVIISMPEYLDKDLWSCEVKTLNDYLTGENSVINSKYGNEPRVIVGDYDKYKLALKRRFKTAQDLQESMCVKYKTKETFHLKKMMSQSEATRLRLSWVHYFELKNAPYARHHQFRTIHKVQGKAFDTVVINWTDIPEKDLRYVALSRAINEIIIVKS